MKNAAFDRNFNLPILGIPLFELWSLGYILPFCRLTVG